MLDNFQENKPYCVSIHSIFFQLITRFRGGGSTGAAGAFAPVNLQQRVHCTRPDEEMSYKWFNFSLKMSFLSPKRSLLMEKCGTIFNFWGLGSPL